MTPQEEISQLEQMLANTDSDPRHQDIFRQMRERLEFLKSQQEITTAKENYTNINSPYYQNLKKYISANVSENTPNINSLIGLSMSMGGDYGGSQVIANEKMKQINKENTTTVNKGVLGGWLQAQGYATDYTKMGIQNSQFNQSLNYQRQKDEEDRSTSFWNSILGGLGSVGGALTGNWLGGLGKSSDVVNNYGGYGRGTP
jgi:uncharacterized membrane protein YcgQ (UPF0703/DUF1980 family)